MCVVKDIIALMDQIAPSCLAEDWDNSGLQCGSANWPVKKVMVALDPSPEAVASACLKKADMLVTHHPLIFKPLKNLAVDTPMGKIIEQSLHHRMAIFSAHTNLDSVTGGLNDVFAEKIDLRHLAPLAPETDDAYVKLVIYAPESSYQGIVNATFESGAGIIGQYSCCSFRNSGIGTFKPGEDSRPFAGKPEKLEETAEFRIETRVLKNQLDRVLEYVRPFHPYETMAYDVYPLHPAKTGHGIGRVGVLNDAVSLSELSDKIKAQFNLSTLKVSGPLEKMVKKIAICTGSGAGLLSAFFATDADVYISGDLKYHDARDVENYQRALIDVGHFASEVIMIDLIVDRLNELIRKKRIDVHVEPFKGEKDPFCYV